MISIGVILLISKRNLKKAIINLRGTRKSTGGLRIKILIERASEINLTNKSTEVKTIINIENIEKVIITWKEIKCLTINAQKTNLKTIDIPADKSIKWNDVKGRKNLRFKPVDDTYIMEQLIVERTSYHLNQIDGTPFTVKQLVTLIGQDGFTSFSKEILEGSADLSSLKLPPTIKYYIQSLKKKITEIEDNNIIPYDEYVSGFKNWKEKTTISPLG